jgi:threonine dehydratase
MSAGNHGQGVAYHASRLGIGATIVMPRLTPNIKVAGTEALGATVVLHGDTLAEAESFAHALESRERLVWIAPFDDPHVIAGQGTVALEMLVDTPGLDALVVPVGGGGLIAGTAIVARTLAPEVELIGVQSTQYPSMSNAMQGRSEVPGGATSPKE